MWELTLFKVYNKNEETKWFFESENKNNLKIFEKSLLENTSFIYGDEIGRIAVIEYIKLLEKILKFKRIEPGKLGDLRGVYEQKNDMMLEAYLDYYENKKSRFSIHIRAELPSYKITNFGKIVFDKEINFLKDGLVGNIELLDHNNGFSDRKYLCLDNVFNCENYYVFKDVLDGLEFGYSEIINETIHSTIDCLAKTKNNIIVKKLISNKPTASIQIIEDLDSKLSYDEIVEIINQIKNNNKQFICFLKEPLTLNLRDPKEDWKAQHCFVYYKPGYENLYNLSSIKTFSIEDLNSIDSREYKFANNLEKMFRNESIESSIDVFYEEMKKKMKINVKY